MLSAGFTSSPSNPIDSAQTAGSKTGDTMGQNTITVTDADFATAVASDTPTLVDF